MSDTVIAAIISAATAILVVPLTAIVTLLVSRWPLLPIDDERAGLAGIWRGMLYQDDVTTIEIESVELNLSFKRKRVSGNGHFSGRSKISGEVLVVNLTFTGGFLYQRFVKLEYRNADVNTVQFGAAVLELSADSKELTGTYAGFGSITGEIVKGRLSFRKVSVA